MTSAEIPKSRADAKASGSLHYFTGVACASGHLSNRWARNGECVECARVRRAPPESRERSLAYSRKAYTERRDQILERQRLAREADPERFRLNQARYCERNPDKRRASQNSYYARNRGRYLELNRVRERGVKLATPAWADRGAIEAVYLQARQLEEQTGVAHHVDHVVPIKGVDRHGQHVACGLHVHNNLVPLPAAKNRAKTNKFEVTA